MTLPPSHDSDDETPTFSPNLVSFTARPLNDVARLNALNRLGICSPDSNGRFERFVRLIQRSLKPQLSFIVLVDPKSQFVKASTGLPELNAAAGKSPLLLALNQTVCTTNTPLILCDPAEVRKISSADHDSTELGAYLGYPINTPDGFTIGALVAIEIEPRTWSQADLDGMQDVAELVESEIEHTHEHLLATARKQAMDTRYKKILGSADCLIWDAEVTCTTSGWEWHFTIQPSGLGLRLFGTRNVRNQNGPWESFQLADQAQMNQRSRQAMRSGQSSYSQEFLVKSPHGSMVWIREVVAISSMGGNRYWLVGVATDITQHKNLETELNRVRDDALDASRLKSQFLANMSHEIRTPMNGIVGMVSLLMESKLEEEQRRIAHVIQESGDSLLAIINDVLDLSKIEAGMLSIDPNPFDLRKIVLAVATLLHAQANRKGITVACEISERLPSILLGDGNRLRQVVTNLVGNAVNYTDSGSVTIKLEVLELCENACEFRLTVADTGPGIPPEVQKKLFQPFVQADNGETLGRGGTGLGLAISKRLVEAMGGTIDMDSEPGSGSAFWFELALDITDDTEVEIPESAFTPPPIPTSHRPTPNPAPPRSPALAHVLVVEDNPTNQVVATLILTGMGISFRVANNGQEGLDILSTAHFDAILMDCQMPVLDGYATTQRVRSGAVPRTNPNIPIIALTAYAMVGDRERCLSVGMNEHVSKPIRMADLRSALQRCGVIPDETKSVPAVSARVSNLMDPELVAEYRSMPGERHATVLEDLIAHYLATTEQNIETLRRRIENGDTEESAQLAHTIAGTCANLGARSVRSAFIAVEKAVRNGTKATALEQLDACQALLAQLNREAQRLLGAAA